MIRVGVTGGLGSGKSTVLELMAAKGAETLSADDVAKEMIAFGGPAYHPVARRFPDALKADQTIDHKRLAAKVFTDARSLAWLNGLVHPLVAHRLEDLMNEMEKRGVEVAAVEVPLLVEARFERQFDFIVCVKAPMELRLARLAAQGWRESNARRRIEAQASDCDREAVAHAVIDNNGSERKLAAAVDKVFKQIQESR